MKRRNNAAELFCLVSALLIFCLVSSCKKKEPDASNYVEAITLFANQQNKKCPVIINKSTKLESVTFGNNMLTYRYTVSDEGITTVNVNDSNTRKSIIGDLSEQLREYLVKGNCMLKYLYVSQHDSSYLEIIPAELESTLQTNKQ